MDLIVIYGFYGYFISRQKESKRRIGDCVSRIWFCVVTNVKPSVKTNDVGYMFAFKYPGGR